MLRRSATRKISNYEFGHPDLCSSLGGQVFSKPKAAIDHGIKTTTLPNGMKVVTHDRGGPQCSIGYYMKAGAKYDGVATPGLSWVLRHALLTSNLENSLFQIDRAFRAVGGNYDTDEVAKQWIAIKSTILRQHWKVPIDVFQAAVAAPRFEEADIERFRDTWDNQLEELRFQQPREYCIHEVEQVAFFKEPLGSPRMVPPDHNDTCSSEALIKQYCRLVKPDRMVLSAINVAHEEVVAAVANAPFTHSSNAPHHQKCGFEELEQTNEWKQYCPGKYHYHLERRATKMGSKPEYDEEAIYALAWPTYGRDASIGQYATGLVVAEQLAIALQDGINWDRSMIHRGNRPFLRQFSSIGLMGVTGRNSPDKITADIQAASKVLRTMGDLNAAKARAEVAFAQNNTEMDRDYLAFLATSPYTFEDTIAAIRKVSTTDAASLLERVRESLPCFYTTGSNDYVPSMRSLGFI